VLSLKMCFSTYSTESLNSPIGPVVIADRCVDVLIKLECSRPTNRTINNLNLSFTRCEKQEVENATLFKSLIFLLSVTVSDVLLHSRL